MHEQGRSTLPTDESGRILDRLEGLEKVISPSLVRQVLQATGRVNGKSPPINRRLRSLSALPIFRRWKNGAIPTLTRPSAQRKRITRSALPRSRRLSGGIASPGRPFAPRGDPKRDVSGRNCRESSPGRRGRPSP